MSGWLVAARWAIEGERPALRSLISASFLDPLKARLLLRVLPSRDASPRTGRGGIRRLGSRLAA
jgi:hypothetical protein